MFPIIETASVILNLREFEAKLMSQKMAGKNISRSNLIRKLWKKEESRYQNAKNSVEKAQIKKEIYEIIRVKLDLSKKQMPMVRQTVNILLGYKPKSKTT